MVEGVNFTCVATECVAINNDVVDGFGQLLCVRRVKPLATGGEGNISQAAIVEVEEVFVEDGVHPGSTNLVSKCVEFIPIFVDFCKPLVNLPLEERIVVLHDVLEEEKEEEEEEEEEDSCVRGRV